MKTIVEPKEYIENLWGKQRVRDDEVYRLMRYVLREDHDGQVLMHNVVNGQLVVLDREESEMLEKLPMKYTPVMEQLVSEHYLVPNDYDESYQVGCIRSVLRKVNAKISKAIRKFCILPTTACNARCYYCFEKDVKPQTMSEKTADDVVKFIIEQSKGETVHISWFGGEPTVAVDRIDQISKGLSDAGVKFDCSMISNGYLFDKEMITRARREWNLTYVQITVDGTEWNNNRIKAFVGASESPYQRVFRNVRLLLDNGVRVSLRMNYDLDNYGDFEELLKEVSVKLPGYSNLDVYAHPVLGEYPDKKGNIHHGSEEWLEKTNYELNASAERVGLHKPAMGLPFLEHAGCSADDDAWLTISPQGYLSKCMEQVDEKQSVGNCLNGITDYTRLQSWKEIADYDKCKQCPLYPKCVRMKNCGGGGRCHTRNELINQFKKNMVTIYLNKSKTKGETYHVS